MAIFNRSVDPDSIDDWLGKDHERIEALLDGLVDAVHTHSTAAPAVFEEVDQALRIHMKWEEEVLFPAVRVRASETQRRSIESLQIDHERIVETLKFLGTALRATEYKEARMWMEWLDVLLQGHNYDEEHGVYNDADQLLDPGERRLLLESFTPSSMKPA